MALSVLFRLFAQLGFWLVLISYAAMVVAAVIGIFSALDALSGALAVSILGSSAPFFSQMPVAGSCLAGMCLAGVALAALIVAFFHRIAKQRS